MTLGDPIGALPGEIAELYPFQPSLLSLGNEHMSYLDEGDRALPPLVLVHGVLGWSFLWRKVIPHVTDSYRVVAPDNIGSGLSSKPNSRSYHTLDRHIENLTVLIESLGLENITLVLHGWGGPIGLGYAVRHPENVARLLLINSWAGPPSGAGYPPLPSRIRRFCSAWFPRRIVDTASRFLIRRELRRDVATPMPDAVMRGYLHPFKEINGCMALWTFTYFAGAPAGSDSRAALEGIEAKLGEIKAPVEVLWGMRNPLFGGVMRPFLLRDSFPDGRGPFLRPDAGHLLPEDDPQAVVERLLAQPEQPGQPPFRILQ